MKNDRELLKTAPRCLISPVRLREQLRSGVLASSSSAGPLWDGAVACWEGAAPFEPAAHHLPWRGARGRTA